MCQNIGGVKIKDARQNRQFQSGTKPRFRKGDTTGDFENETEAPICYNTGHQFRSVTKRNINEMEIPLQKTTYFNFCGIVFFHFFLVHEVYGTGTTNLGI